MSSNYSLNQGISCFERKEYKKAVKEFKKALNIDPAQPIGWLLLAATYSEQGKFDKALEASEFHSLYHLT